MYHDNLYEKPEVLRRGKDGFVDEGGAKFPDGFKRPKLSDFDKRGLSFSDFATAFVSAMEFVSLAQGLNPISEIERPTLYRRSSRTKLTYYLREATESTQYANIAVDRWNLKPDLIWTAMWDHYRGEKNSLTNTVKNVCELFEVTNTQADGVYPEQIAQHIRKKSEALLLLAKDMSGVEFVELMQGALYFRLLPKMYDDVLRTDRPLSFVKMQSIVQHSANRARHRHEQHSTMVDDVAMVVTNARPSQTPSRGFGGDRTTKQTYPKHFTCETRTHADRGGSVALGHGPKAQGNNTPHRDSSPASAGQRRPWADKRARVCEHCKSMGKEAKFFTNHSRDSCWELHPSLRQDYGERQHYQNVQKRVFEEIPECID